MTAIQNPYSNFDHRPREFDYLPTGVKFFAQVFSDDGLPQGYTLHRLANNVDPNTQWAVYKDGQQVAIEGASHAVSITLGLNESTAVAINELRRKAHAHAAEMDRVNVGNSHNH